MTEDFTGIVKPDNPFSYCHLPYQPYGTELFNSVKPYRRLVVRYAPVKNTVINIIS